MPSEALRSVAHVPGVGLKPVCAGDTLVRYRLGTHKPCAACNHRHRFDAPDGEGGEIVFDAACPECPCRANGARYDAGIRDHDLVAAHDHDNAASAPEHDDDGPASGPRRLPGGSGGLGDDGQVRGGRQERSTLRLLRDLPVILAGVWGRSVRSGSWRGDPGRAGADWYADRRPSSGHRWL